MAGPGSGPVGPGSEDVAAVPHAVLRSWDEAEARLFPTIMARPDVYQQAVSLIQQLLGRLRETCLDLPSLLAAHERGMGTEKGGQFVRRQRDIAVRHVEQNVEDRGKSAVAIHITPNDT